VLKDLIDHGHKVRRISLGKSRMGLHCMTTGAGYEKRFNEAYSWDGMQRGDDPFLVIQHTLAGRGQLDYAGTRHSLGVGETMLLSFPHANRYWLARGDAWEYFWMTVNGREALRIARAVLDAAGPVLHLPPHCVDRLASSALTALDGEPLLAGEASAAAYGAMMALQDGVFGEEEAEVEALPPLVMRARQYIDAHLGEQLDVERVAQVAGVSRAHFVRAFGAAMGVPPSDYVFEKRMERASRLLLATDNAVLVVAEACGFADGNYFAKAFRRAYGVSPSEYRAAGATLLMRR